MRISGNMFFIAFWNSKIDFTYESVALKESVYPVQMCYLMGKSSLQSHFSEQEVILHHILTPKKPDL